MATSNKKIPTECDSDRERKIGSKSQRPTVFINGMVSSDLLLFSSIQCFGSAKMMISFCIYKCLRFSLFAFFFFALFFLHTWVCHSSAHVLCKQKRNVPISENTQNKIITTKKEKKKKTNIV